MFDGHSLPKFEKIFLCDVEMSPARLMMLIYYLESPAQNYLASHESALVVSILISNQINIYKKIKS